MKNNDHKSEVDVISQDIVKQAAEQTANPAAVFTEALLKLPSDPASLYEDTVLDALRTIRRKDEAAYTRLTIQAKGHKTKLDKLTAPNRDCGDGSDGSDLSTLIRIAEEKCVLGHDPDGRGIAVIDDGNIRQVWLLKSQGFDDWLRAAYFNVSRSGVSETLITSAVCTLEAIAKHKGAMMQIHLRCAKHGDAYYIDRCDELWTAIRVDKDGWEVISSPPVLFTRTKNMRPLPIPQRPGKVEKLWAYLNIPEITRALLLPWIIECYRPDTPFPILELSGEQGSAKSTNQRRMRDLVDPNKVPLRGSPKTVEDIYVSAANNYVVSFENLSYLSSEQQDALCTLATGGGFATRQFYTNGDEHVLETKRPVMANGINPVATQADLIERVISIECPTIPAAQRRDEQTISTEWALDYPHVLAGVLDLFSATLEKLPTVKLESKYRMADFQLLGEAAALVMGHPAGHFTEVYGSTVTDGIGRSMESYGISNALQVLMALRSGSSWEGTTLMLKSELERLHDVDRSNWPKTARGLAGQLKRITPGMRRLGIEIEHTGRSSSGSQLRICYTKNQ